jgi:hypothetical protein
VIVTIPVSGFLHSIRIVALRNAERDRWCSGAAEEVACAFDKPAQGRPADLFPGEVA